MKILKNIFAGLLVGIANVVPGLSGGTLLVLTNTFEPLTNAVSNVIKKDNKNRKKDIFLILQVILGLVVGVLGFYSLLDGLNQYIYAQIMLFFIGIIIFSSLVFVKNEIKCKENFKPLWFIIGFLLCAALVIFVTPGNEVFEANINPSIWYLLALFGVSIIGGATMIFPGLSGSLILYMFGMYFAIWGYAKETVKELVSFTFNWYMIVPCICIGLGVIIGIILGSIVSKRLLNKHRYPTLSLILGLILGGLIKLIPYTKNVPEGITVNWDFVTISTSILAFILGSSLIILIQYFVNKKKRGNEN